MEFFLLYLFVMLDQLRVTLTSWGAFLFFGSLLALIFLTMAVVLISTELGWFSTTMRKFKWWLLIPFILGCILSVTGSLLPSPKQAAIIIGGGTIYNIVTSDKAKEVGGKIGNKLEHELDKLLSVPEEKVGGDIL